MTRLFTTSKVMIRSSQTCDKVVQHTHNLVKDKINVVTRVPPGCNYPFNKLVTTTYKLVFSVWDSIRKSISHSIPPQFE